MKNLNNGVMTGLHLLTINQLSKNDLTNLLDDAQSIISKKLHLKNEEQILKNKIIINLFFEPSTRTRISFEIAAKRLGAEVINFQTERSSILKGEAFQDTIKNINAMGVDLFIVRHSQEGFWENLVGSISSHISVINAGDGCHEHPTQALIDMLTIRQHKHDFRHLTVAIVGDIKHSRVAHSDVEALKKLNCKDIRLIAPPQFLELIPGTKQFANINEGLNDADVVIVLRIQKERMQETELPDTKSYFDAYGVTEKNLTHAKPDCIVMHPGPINRNVEIEDKIIDGERSVILQQVENGIAIRMAILKKYLLKDAVMSY